MEFRIADTFTESLARLTGDEQKAAKTAAFDLQMNPAGTGAQFHKLTQSKDKNFWSVRVGSDIRLIVHKTDGSLLLCYVGHHDKAYAWAERRRLETHPKTGAAQFVLVRETVQEIIRPVFVDPPKPVAAKPTLFARLSDDDLLGFGVPPEWIADVKTANEDTLFLLIDRLPAEAAEALLEIATGGTPRPSEVAAKSKNPFDHPDAQRRFRVMSNVEELERALEYPWDKWTVFLHPEQRQLVEKRYSGAARVAGSAGTGKTIVALHRAVFLARAHRDARILLTTFSETLANALRTRLRRLISNEPRLAERLEVHAIDAIGARLYKGYFGPPKLASRDDVRRLIADAAASTGSQKFTTHFLVSEWEEIVDGRQLESWESYRDFARLGRKSRLTEPQRKTLWSIFSRVAGSLRDRSQVTPAAMFTKLSVSLSQQKSPTFDFAVVDESQDLSVAHLRFLAALGSHRADALFFAGDLGQRIFQSPFSWLSLGVDIRGRSKCLRVNYRTSHQIRVQADRLLGPEVKDADENIEKRTDTISVFNGVPPEISTFPDPAAECTAVSQWIAARAAEGIAPHEIGVFVRSPAELDRAQRAVNLSGLLSKILDNNVETPSGFVSIGTMHLAKGLEFRAVAVLACDDEIIPQKSRLESIAEEADLKDTYDTERQLLYVACTRARDRLFVTCVMPGSEFIEDLARLENRK